MSNKDYKLLSQQLPEQNRLLDCVSENGMSNKLKLIDNLFWTPDETMYVYYVPKYWRYADE